MSIKIGDVFSKVFGFIILLIGIVGLFLPILPGWILIFVGASLINYKKLNVFLKKIKNKFISLFRK